MKRYLPKRSWISILAAMCSCAYAVNAASSDVATPAKQLVDATGVQGGIIVHIGCGDGRLTAALRINDRFTVHGLDADPSKVVEARRHIQSQGIYGPVSVEQFSSPVLPYVANLINLVVVQDAGAVPMDEVMRVLAPGGAACVWQKDKWSTIRKAWPDNIDQWTHFLHDASNNAVADDAVVGPPRSLQWLAPPLWLRSHETPSGIQSPVSAAGRLFYVFDEGLVGITDERIPDRWSLVCRDAFNGKLLWKRPLGSWGWREWSPEQYEGKDWTRLRGKRTDVPPENQRRIVTDGQRVYTTLSFRGPLSILDAVTGETIATIEATLDTSEILVSDGIAVAYTRGREASTARRRGDESPDTAALVAVDGPTGSVLWQKETGRIRPLSLAIDNGRIVHLSGKDMVSLGLKDGRELWRVEPKQSTPRTILTTKNVVVMQGGKHVAAYDAVDGELLWEKTAPSIAGGEGDDLFVVDGLVWRGIVSVDEQGKPTRKSPNALVVGWDLRTGDEKRRIRVDNLRSPEHHHRCYRNKATTRYLISSYEGAEFLDFQADNHSQNNWLRGACKNGMVPCNGMLYVPPDQCFCQPGSKLLGYAAVTAGAEEIPTPVADAERLETGPAYGEVGTRSSEVGAGNSVNASGVSGSGFRAPRSQDWPTFRHDAARSGTTWNAVPAEVVVDWQVELKGPLTAPVAAGGRVFVARSDAHSVYALDAESGEVLWRFTAGGRVDSPPTIHKGMVLFGAKDGYVYCLRASDGQLMWRFLAAPSDRRVAHFDQVESTWPVHGSVLIDNDVVYFTAGRSTYLDGGIRVYGLEPATGRILHKGLLEGPHPDVDGLRDVGFYITGANSDVLVSEGGFLYMRQKKLTPDLDEVAVDVLSSKGAQDVGLHVFSTSGLLDDSWYNRTFWMYSQRWPGFQLANQAPKTGQLLVVDDERTYAVRVFHQRNTHSPMFFPGTRGYLLFADLNSNEPQIVGEPGSRVPVKWLPMSDYSRGRGDEMRALESEAFGLDKMVGYTRAEPPVWMQWLPVRIRAMVKAGDTLFVAGAPDVFDPKDPYAAFEGRRGAQVVSVSARDGSQLSTTQLESPPIFDGMIAAGGRLFASLRDGSVVCLAGR